MHCCINQHTKPLLGKAMLHQKISAKFMFQMHVLELSSVGFFYAQKVRIDIQLWYARWAKYSHKTECQARIEWSDSLNTTHSYELCALDYLQHECSGNKMKERQRKRGENWKNWNLLQSLRCELSFIRLLNIFFVTSMFALSTACSRTIQWRISLQLKRIH